MRAPIVFSLLAFLAPASALADSVVASDKVQSELLVRRSAGGPVIGSLGRGERAAWLATRGGWHEVELAGGRVGYVSTAWSRVVPDSAAPPAALAPSPAEVHVETSEAGLGEAVRGFLGRVGESLGLPPAIELVLQEPVSDGAVYEHDDARLPVAGIATREGSSGMYDLVLALDTSVSTHGFSQADVNGDGRRDERWKGPDSIYQAQIRAARDLVAALGRLPYNRGGERVRVGVVSFAGSEAESATPFDASPAALLELARVDAQERVPLTSDYARVESELARLARQQPAGMTNFAAGVGRALAALGVLGAAPAEPRPSAQKAVLFLTDGKPQRPGDRKSAERAALYASRVAGETGVRLHTYALGHDIVRRAPNPVLRRMAWESAGRFTQLATPGEIVALLRSTSFSFVSEVRLVNATRGGEIATIPTAIDGSFYGELPLAEGANQIEVEAVLNDGSRSSRKVTITWVDTKPRKALQARLAALRQENEALVEELRQRLAAEMQAARKREERRVTISVAK